MKPTTWILVLLFSAALLFGCSKVTRENYDKIRIGMAMTEVTALIGEPDSCSGALGTKKCIWGNETKNITVSFVGDHVAIPSMTGL